MRKTSLHIILLGLIISMMGTSCSDFQKMLKSDDMDARYDAAIAYYDHQDYYRAGLLLEELIPILRGTKKAEKALFYYAYCHYYQDQLYLSAFYFDNLYNTYPRSPYEQEARYMKARAEYESTPTYNLDQSGTIKTLQDLQSVINRYPNSQYVKDCDRMIDDLNQRMELKAFENAKLYYNLQYFKSAVIALNTFREEFPTSSLVEEAAFLRIESQFKLAKLSIEDKRKERYMEVITFYQDFVDTFPSSKFVRQAENYYDMALEKIEKPN